jgi:hypothetical protein
MFICVFCLCLNLYVNRDSEKSLRKIQVHFLAPRWLTNRIILCKEINFDGVEVGLVEKVLKYYLIRSPRLNEK